MAMPLRGRSFQITGDQPSLRFAGELLRHLGAGVEFVAGDLPSISALAGKVELPVEPDPAPFENNEDSNGGVTLQLSSG